MIEERSDLDFMSLMAEGREPTSGPAIKTVRIALLSDAAPQYSAILLKALMSRQHVHSEIYEADYDTIEMETLDPSSGFYAFKPQVVVILQSTWSLRSRYYGRTDPKTEFTKEVLSKMTQTWETIRARLDATVIQTNFVLPYERPFGNYEWRVGKSFFHETQAINAGLAEYAKGISNVYLCDMDYLASYHGRKNWFDEKLWILSKAYCALDHLPQAIKSIVDIIGSLNGAGVKCLVLDLDDTLWGGVIGDDGLEGIHLGHFEDGEAFEAFQHFLKKLKERGILLAVCSKNDPEKALQPFREHPDMILKESDITAFVANWQNKVENIMAIREMLNISYSSMVFIDDNPFERNLVRAGLPGILVPEMPEDPAQYVKYLNELNLFETTSYSELDAERATLYRVDAQRKIAGKQYSNFDDYLKSTQMKITLKRFDPFQLPRIAQLLQRSNQFNLLTRRFTEAQCETFMRDEKGWLPIYLELKDKYGDSGLISVIIARVSGGTLSIEEWVMSCRVLARGVEQCAMNYLFAFTKKNRIKTVRGRYEPTAKNQMVKNFFSRFDFRKTQENSDGAIDWQLATDLYEPQAHFIEFENEETVTCKDLK